MAMLASIAISADGGPPGQHTPFMTMLEIANCPVI